METPTTFLASDLSFAVWLKRQRRQELDTPALSDQNRRLFAVPSLLVQREAWTAEPVTQEAQS